MIIPTGRARPNHPARSLLTAEHWLAKAYKVRSGPTGPLLVIRLVSVPI